MPGRAVDVLRAKRLRELIRAQVLEEAAPV
jgi:hypothetical protein